MKTAIGIFLSNNSWWLCLLALLGAMQLYAWWSRPVPLAYEVTAQMQWRMIERPQALTNNPARPLRFLARIESAQDQAVAPGLIVRGYCYAPCDRRTLLRGARYAGVVSLLPPDFARNPVAFDYAGWLHDQGIGAIASLRTPPQLVQQPGWLDSLHNRVTDALFAATADFANQPVLLALLTGQRELLDERQQRLLKETSTMHLVVVSGMHLGLAFALCLFAFRFAGAPQLAQLVCGALGMLAYVWLAGFGAPAVRALVMALIAAWFVSRIRQHNLAFAWLLALVMVAGWQFAFWRNPGIVLSFGAVAILLLMAQGWRSGNRLWLLFKVQWVLFVLLGVMQAWLFQRVSPVGFAANMLMVPMVGFALLPLVLMGALLSVLPSQLAGWLFALADTLVSFCWTLLSWLHSLPLASIAIPGELLGEWWVVAGCALLAITLLLPVGFVFGRVLPLVALLPLVWWQADIRQPPLLLATRNDMYVMLRDRQRALVIASSGGRQLSASDMRYVLVPALRYARIKEIDWLALNEPATKVQLDGVLRQDQSLQQIEHCRPPVHWPQVRMVSFRHAPGGECVVDLNGWRIGSSPAQLHIPQPAGGLVVSSEGYALAMQAGYRHTMHPCWLIGRRMQGLDPCIWPQEAKFLLPLEGRILDRYDGLDG